MLVIWCFEFLRGLFFAVFLARIVIHKLHPDFSLFELLRIDRELVHVARAGRRHDPLAVELEAAGMAGTLKYFAIGHIADEAAEMRANGVEAGHLVALTAEIHGADQLI